MNPDNNFSSYFTDYATPSSPHIPMQFFENTQFYDFSDKISEENKENNNNNINGFPGLVFTVPNILENEDIIAGNNPTPGLDVLALQNLKAFADQSLSTASSIISSQNTAKSEVKSLNSNDMMKKEEEGNGEKKKKTKKKKSKKAGKKRVFDEKLNSKGCKCKRSKCKKGFCECMDNASFCSDGCGCSGCNNLNPSLHTFHKNSPRNCNERNSFLEENNCNVVIFSKKVKLN